jgi:hypothetical protein
MPTKGRPRKSGTSAAAAGIPPVATPISVSAVGVSAGSVVSVQLATVPVTAGHGVLSSMTAVAVQSAPVTVVSLDGDNNPLGNGSAVGHA